MTDGAIDPLHGLLPPGGTYFGRPERVDTSEWPARHALSFHVGDVLLAAADLDANLTTLIAVLVNRDHPNRELAKGRFVSDKIQILESVYPQGWRDTNALTRSLKRVTQDRNSLAHAFWEPDLEALKETDPSAMEDEPQELKLRLHREKSKKSTPVDFNALYQTRVDVGLLNMVCLDITNRWLFGELDDVSIPEYVQSLGENPLYIGWPKSAEWAADVNRVFSS
ncbi:hypothetical protein [Microbacterium galbinum]|uniref:DUF4145 domain-containing protein n=1 Tax=Microbacterium galbinum TaxID=2851646 RepID=A0ABY4INL1_9MICO|nr:hypothetical protein [Microbacterium galbinum]UPL13220.1 hypothetical protein KV396_01465 [Microbacterium galbinum]